MSAGGLLRSQHSILCIFAGVHKAVLLLGTNMGNRTHSLVDATNLIAEAGRVVASSAIYETEPWGNTDQPSFLNKVVVLETQLSARQLLNAILQAEKKLGRERTVKWAPRIIDIDILFYDDDIISEEGLTVPHPLMQERRFAMAPLAEVMPDYIHPVFKRKVSDIYKECGDEQKVELYIDDSI